MAARKPRTGFKLTDDHRGKIQNSSILNCLIEHVLGKRELSATQVTAGIALMRKVLPDLASIEHQGEVQSFVVQVPETLSQSDWAAKYAGPAPAQPKPDTTH